MTDSILDSTKKVLGLDPSYEAFDPDVLMHINSVFSTLHQLGLGPEAGFTISDNSATWDQFIGDMKHIESVKTYVYMRVRFIFDPPTTSFAIGAMKEQIQELEWRLNVVREGTEWETHLPPIS